ncbi:hypothetical protein [Flavobacterium sp.]|uniref:hypothetical protein n=1 Tax=Flavobacterium sp. TaxID=239 RepID=UPI0038D0C9AB
MNEEELKRIYNLITQKFELDTSSFPFQKFSQGMSTPEGRLKFWKQYKGSLGLGKYNSYEAKFKVPEPEYYKPEKHIPSTDMSGFKSKPCDENTYNWSYGCMNKKIGALNQKFFGDELGQKYGQELLNKLINLGLLDNKNTIITKEIFDKLLPNYGSIQESKIIKETVKNILLKELFK